MSNELSNNENAARPPHLHTYKRVRHKTRKDLWMCNDPYCTNRTNRIFLEGKAARCPYCGEEFIITRRKLDKQSLLHCDGCKRGARGAARRGMGNDAISTQDEILKKLEELL